MSILHPDTIMPRTMQLKMFPVLSVPSFFYLLLSPFPSFLLCSFSAHSLNSYITSDTANIEKRIPLVLSSVCLLGDVLSGKPDKEADYYNAVRHLRAWRLKERPKGTQRGDSDAWKDFSKEPFQLRLDG